LLILLLLPKYLFPIQLVLLITYGFGKKYLSGWIQSIMIMQPSIQSDSSFLSSGDRSDPSQLLGCSIRFVILLASLALAICGALWVLAYEQDPWIVYPAVIVIGLFFLFARLSEYAHLIHFVSRIVSKEGNE